MPDESFASTQDMSDRTQGNVPADTPFLDKALAAASRRIRNYCGWHIFPVLTAEDWLVQTSWGSPLWLPSTHVVSVDEISDGGIAIDPSTLRVTAGGRISETHWTGPTLVTFTHGYEEAPEDLLALTLELAFGDLLGRGVIREQTLASSVTWARVSGRLTTEDKNDIAAYKIGYQP